jgi:glycosyltransferase involved in cell wall biosynthesis
MNSTAMKSIPEKIQGADLEGEAGRDVSSICLGVIMPVYNESRTIDEIIRRVLAQPSVCELIVVDDASNDGSLALLRQWPQRDRRVRVLEHRKNRGKGAAVQTAWATSTAPIIIMQDADLEYDPNDYSRMLELILSNQADVVYGSRFIGEKNSKNPGWHTFGNRCLTWCSNLASGLKLTDEATCYKMFRREVLARIELEEEGFGFCPEVTAKTSKLGVRILEVPVAYQGRTRAEGKKIRFRHGWNALHCIIKYYFFHHP